jgi:hypothetical protein
MPKYKIKEGDKPWAFYKLTRRNKETDSDINTNKRCERF